MDKQKYGRNRNTALMLVFAGLFLLLGNITSFSTVTAILFIIMAVYLIKEVGNKGGYILFGIGAVLILNENLVSIVILIFIVAGFFYYKSNATPKSDNMVQRHNLLESLKYNKDPWVARHMSLATLIGEIKMDFSLAVLEERETTFTLHGVIGDVDIIVPEDIALRVESSTVIGQIRVMSEGDEGLMNKIVWQSPGWEESEYRVKLDISYVIGDINVRSL